MILWSFHWILEWFYQLFHRFSCFYFKFKLLNCSNPSNKDYLICYYWCIQYKLLMDISTQFFLKSLYKLPFQLKIVNIHSKAVESRRSKPTSKVKGILVWKSPTFLDHYEWSTVRRSYWYRTLICLSCRLKSLDTLWMHV